MRVLTNNPEIAESYLDEKLHWREMKADEFEHPLKCYVNEFLPGAFSLCADTAAESIWDYLFVVDRAEDSQMAKFDKLLNENLLKGNVLALAEEGEEFKGFRDRPWEALKGNIHYTAHVEPNIEANQAFLGFTILLAVSAIQTVQAIPYIESPAGIKWVNDIMIEGRKISGIIARSRLSGSLITNVIMGIGMNVESTPQIRTTNMEYDAGSLNDFLPEPNRLSRFEAFRILDKKVQENYKLLLNGGYDELLNIYRKNSLVLGKEVAIWSDPLFGSPELIYEGKVVDIGQNLELYFENQAEPVIAGRIRSIKA